MADHQGTILIDKDLRPAYYDDFHCLAADCRFSCCKGWRISFDKRDYLSLKRQAGSPEFNTRIENALRRIRKDPPAGHYGEFDMHTGACPLLREDCLCALQLEKGHSALPKVCQVFPRGESSVSSGYLERSLSPACEGVLELLWNLPEGIAFRSDPLPKDKWKRMRIREGQPLAEYFPVVREWCVDRLQDRRFPIPERLLILGMGLWRLAEGEAVEEWLPWALALPENTDGLTIEQSDRALSKFLSSNLRVLTRIKVSGTNFQGIRGELAKGVGIQIRIRAEESVLSIPIQPYREAQGRYNAAFKEREYFMENLLVALLFHLYMPDLSSPEALWKSYANLCSLYSFYRFAAVMSCREGASGDKAELFRQMVCVSRGLIHNRGFQNTIRDELFQHDSATLAHMAILLCG